MISWDDPQRLALIAVQLEDCASPSFCTFSMTCFGEETALREYCRQEDLDAAAWSRESRMEEYLDRSLKGEQLTWADMGASKLIVDAHPKVLGRARIESTAFETVHFNIWDCPYTFTAERVETEVVWLEYVPAVRICRDLPYNEDPSSARYKNAMANATLSTEPIDAAYVRAIRVRMEHPNEFYGEGGMFIVEGERTRDGIKAFSTRLFMIDKGFETYEELKADMDGFSPEQIDYSPIFDAQLGDG